MDSQRAQGCSRTCLSLAPFTANPSEAINVLTINLYGAMIMTLEVGVRFLTDYLMGDVYFRTHYPKHNLVRCRTQFALLKDMLVKQEEMNRIVARVAKEVRG